MIMAWISFQLLTLICAEVETWWYIYAKPLLKSHYLWPFLSDNMMAQALIKSKNVCVRVLTCMFQLTLEM